MIECGSHSSSGVTHVFCQENCRVAKYQISFLLRGSFFRVDRSKWLGGIAVTVFDLCEGSEAAGEIV